MNDIISQGGWVGGALKLGPTAILIVRHMGHIISTLLNADSTHFGMMPGSYYSLKDRHHGENHGI